MSFDWAKLEHDQRERDQRLTLWAGVGWLAPTLLVLAVGLVTGHLGKLLVPALFYFVLGGFTIVVGLRLRRRRPAPGPPTDDSEDR